ncbi:hypothetical protein HO133_002945 [Letharia lupina]|uniref:Uncharacterized protein n=1 Tax=Letharia lupina TaxID=560253 RepID=A0A8H6CBQ6_9LECA|nr:uncharacterized protein HO133_002945 [Letharia lupina]KAF6220512.1 hypothetical protein HO133_002945 [Letharia lupina]
MSFTRFLALPLEIRNQIYASHFRATTITYPTFTLPPLLSTSHRIHTEALPSLRPNATYNLLTTEHLVDHLTTLTPASLAQLRHISLRGLPLPVYPSDDDSCYHTHLFPSLLPLFQGLRLDTLEVTDAYHGEDVCEDGWGHNATYYDLEGMIKEGQGWKELVFKSASDRWLDAVVFESRAADGAVTRETNGRDKQPGAWDRMIKERDGEESGARVEMWSRREGGVWRKVEGDYNAEVEDPAGQDCFEGNGEPVLSIERQGDDESDVGPVRPSIEVRVRRGKGAEYVQDGRSMDEHKYSRKLREMFEKLGWKEIKAQGLFIPGAEDDPTSHL